MLREGSDSVKVGICGVQVSAWEFRARVQTSQNVGLEQLQEESRAITEPSSFARLRRADSEMKHIKK